MNFCRAAAPPLRRDVTFRNSQPTRKRTIPTATATECHEHHAGIAWFDSLVKRDPRVQEITVEPLILPNDPLSRNGNVNGGSPPDTSPIVAHRP